MEISKLYSIDEIDSIPSENDGSEENNREDKIINRMSIFTKQNRDNSLLPK